MRIKYNLLPWAPIIIQLSSRQTIFYFLTLHGFSNINLFFLFFRFLSVRLSLSMSLFFLFVSLYFCLPRCLFLWLSLYMSYFSYSCLLFKLFFVVCTPNHLFIVISTVIAFPRFLTFKTNLIDHV